MMRDTIRKAHGHAKRLLGHVATFVGHVDRALGTAARIYNVLAPIVAPHAINRLGSERAHAIHDRVSSGVHHYSVAREGGMRIASAIGLHS